MESINIKDKIDELRNLKRIGYSESYIKKHNTEFYERYPIIFKMALDLSFDFKHIDYMLEMKDKVTQNNLNEMDKEVYDVLQKEYIPEHLRSSNITT